jgi:hypothetical protein
MKFLVNAVCLSPEGSKELLMDVSARFVNDLSTLRFLATNMMSR